MIDQDPFAVGIAAIGWAVFSAFQLYRAIMTGRTWYWHVSDMDRQRSPWNF